MKYQIYLNKETSTIIEKVAQTDNKKPNTLIKELLEGMFRIAQATAIQTEKEIKNYGNRKQEK